MLLRVYQALKILQIWQYSEIKHTTWIINIYKFYKWKFLKIWLMAFKIKLHDTKVDQIRLSRRWELRLFHTFFFTAVPETTNKKDERISWQIGDFLRTTLTLFHMVLNFFVGEICFHILNHNKIPQQIVSMCLSVFMCVHLWLSISGSIYSFSK